MLFIDLNAAGSTFLFSLRLLATAPREVTALSLSKLKTVVILPAHSAAANYWRTDADVSESRPQNGLRGDWAM